LVVIRADELMQHYKKRVRLLVERHGGEIDYSHDGAIRLRFESNSVVVRSVSCEAIECAIDLGDGPRCLRLPMTCVFDVVDRLAAPHRAESLRDYHPPAILQLEDYIREEYAAECVRALREQIVEDPKLVETTLGGNRILAEYYRGVLILTDDLGMAGTNVVEL
jgi:hypothetical protein